MLVAREKPDTRYALRQRAKERPGQWPRRKFASKANSNPVVRKHRTVSPSSGAETGFRYLRESLQLFVLLFLLVIIGIGLINQHGRIIACNYRIHQLKGEMASLEEEKESLLIEVQRLGSLERIEKIALNKLGLKHPDKKQWLVLSTPANGD